MNVLKIYSSTLKANSYAEYSIAENIEYYQS